MGFYHDRIYHLDFFTHATRRYTKPSTLAVQKAVGPIHRANHSYSSTHSAKNRRFKLADELSVADQY